MCCDFFILILIFHHKVSVFFSFFHAHFSFLKVLFLINIPFNFWDFWIFVCLFSFRKNVVKSDGVIFVSSFFITFLFTFGRGVRFYTPALLRMAASGQGFLLLPASFEDKIRATFEFSFFPIEFHKTLETLWEGVYIFLFLDIDWLFMFWNSSNESKMWKCLSSFCPFLAITLTNEAGLSFKNVLVWTICNKEKIIISNCFFLLEKIKKKFTLPEWILARTCLAGGRGCSWQQLL